MVPPFITTLALLLKSLYPKISRIRSELVILEPLLMVNVPVTARSALHHEPNVLPCVVVFSTVAFVMVILYFHAY